LNHKAAFIEIKEENSKLLESHDKIMNEINSLLATIIKITAKHDNAQKIHQIAKDLHNTQNAFSKEYNDFLVGAVDRVTWVPEIQVHCKYFVIFIEPNRKIFASS
jgi:hypothetical protein